jgi:uncharacterized protein (DUF305 family)
METKSLLFGLIGFFIGGLLVSVAATTFDKPKTDSSNNEVTMSQMTDILKPLKGDEYDNAFIKHMIEHHQAAVDMAKLSANRANHQEIKDLSLEIVSAQEKEIDEMKRWQTDWGFATSTTDHSTMGH